MNSEPKMRLMTAAEYYEWRSEHEDDDDFNDDGMDEIVADAQEWAEDERRYGYYSRNSDYEEQMVRY